MEMTLLLFVLLGMSSIHAEINLNSHGPALAEIHTPLHDKCVQEFPVTDEDIAKVRSGIFDDNNIQMKEYILCLWKSCGLLDISTFRLNNILLKVYVPDILNKGKGPDMFLECATRGRNLPNGTPLRDRTWVLMKCVQETDPEHFIMY